MLQIIIIQYTVVIDKVDVLNFLPTYSSGVFGTLWMWLWSNVLRVVWQRIVSTYKGLQFHVDDFCCFVLCWWYMHIVWLRCIDVQSVDPYGRVVRRQASTPGSIQCLALLTEPRVRSGQLVTSSAGIILEIMPGYDVTEQKTVCYSLWANNVDECW